MIIKLFNKIRLLVCAIETRASIYFTLLSAVYLTLTAYDANSMDLKLGVSEGNSGALRYVDQKFNGALADKYTCVIENTELNWSIRVLPQARILHNLRNGELDAGIPLAHGKDRDVYAEFSSTIFDAPFYLYTNEELSMQDDFSGLVFGTLRASFNVDLINQRNAKALELNEYMQAIKMTRLGRIDGVVIPAPVVSSFSEEVLKEMTKHAFGSQPAGIYISKKAPRHKHILEKINVAINACLKLSQPIKTK